MRQKENETTPDLLTPEELTELQKLLQTDNIAPVDRMTFGRRLFGSASKPSIADVPPISLAPVTI
jgi:hypothetical protein